MSATTRLVRDRPIHPTIYVASSVCGRCSVVRADVGLSGPQDRVLIVETERELIQRLVDVVQGEDPDMLVGYEVQRLSWGYVKARCHTLGIPFIDHMSRLHIPKQSPHRTHEGSKSDDKKKGSNTIDTVFRAPSGGRSRSSRAALWAQKKICWIRDCWPYCAQRLATSSIRVTTPSLWHRDSGTARTWPTTSCVVSAQSSPRPRCRSTPRSPSARRTPGCGFRCG